jgi:hypothetical protein
MQSTSSSVTCMCHRAILLKPLLLLGPDWSNTYAYGCRAYPVRKDREPAIRILEIKKQYQRRQIALTDYLSPLPEVPVKSAPIMHSQFKLKFKRLQYRPSCLSTITVATRRLLTDRIANSAYTCGLAPLVKKGKSEGLESDRDF